MGLLILFIGAGFLLGLWPRTRGLAPYVEKMVTAFLIVMVLAMGMQLGGSEEVMASLRALGYRLALLSLAPILFTIVAVMLVQRLMGTKFAGGRPQDGEGRGDVSLSLLVSSTLFLGVLVGRYLPAVSRTIDTEAVILYSLSALFVGIGVGLGQNVHVFRQIGELGLRVLLLPLATVVASVAGGVLAASFGGISYGLGAAVGAGMGYYTLTAALITGSSGPEAGSLAFVANVVRELVTITGAPLLARLGVMVPIAVGGCTSLDSSLPALEWSLSKEMVVVAIVSGFVLSVLAPVLIPLLLLWG